MTRRQKDRERRVCRAKLAQLMTECGMARGKNATGKDGLADDNAGLTWPRRVRTRVRGSVQSRTSWYGEALGGSSIRIIEERHLE